MTNAILPTPKAASGAPHIDGETARQARPIDTDPLAGRPELSSFSQIAGDPPTKPAAAPDYERLRALAALYDQVPRARRPMFRSALVLITLAVGASAGLVATWWMAGGGHAAATATLSPAAQRGHGDMPIAPHAGISANELPYDGRGTHAASSAPATNPEELPYGGQPSTAQARRGGTDATGSARLKGVSPVAGKSAPIGALSGGDKNVTQPRKAANPHRSGARATKDHEFERIRKQADEELKKKAERGRPPGNAHTRSHASSSHAVSRNDAPRASSERSRKALLAKCERAGNFIRREQCKWRLCSGTWGKNGCPSYAHVSPY